VSGRILQSIETHAERMIPQEVSDDQKSPACRDAEDPACRTGDESERRLID
jgi:hypothetical protein